MFSSLHKVAGNVVHWSCSMILALSTRGPGFNSLASLSLLIQYAKFGVERTTLNRGCLSGCIVVLLSNIKTPDHTFLNSSNCSSF